MNINVNANANSNASAASRAGINARVGGYGNLRGGGGAPPSSWTGIAPMLDRAPILGEAPGLPGFHNALCGVAYTLGPICGRLAAEELLHGTKPDPRFTLARFG